MVEGSRCNLLPSQRIGLLVMDPLNLKKTTVYISQVQDKELKSLSAESSIRVSELIRRAIEDYLVKFRTHPPQARRL